MRFKRRKPRHLLASFLYKLNRFLPFTKAAKLDLMLDLAWITHRLSIENGAALGLSRRDENRFLHDRIKRTDRVLDIGCATGEILGNVNTVERVGIDYDATLIEIARSRYPDVTFIVGEARRYLEGADKFDVLILSHVLEHIDEPERFLGSLRDRFERIYVEVPDLEWTDINRLRIERQRQLIYTDNDHVVEFDRAELEGIFANLDFTVIDSEFRYGVMRYWIS